MNDREQFEAWFSRYIGITHQAEDVRHIVVLAAWQACAESKQSELDKANARIAQLESILNHVLSEFELTGDLSEITILRMRVAMSQQSDTWLSEHDKAVEVKVLEDVRQQNADTYLDIIYRVDEMIESRK